MHHLAWRFIQRAAYENEVALKTINVLDFGAYDVNGSPRSIFPFATYTGVDVRPGPAVDVVCDAADYVHPFKVDVVVCAETLEHCPHAERIVQNACRNLKRGGLFIMTCAGEGRAPHGCDGGVVGDEYYHNVTYDEFQSWLLDGNWSTYVIEHDAAAGDLRAWAVRA